MTLVGIMATHSPQTHYTFLFYELFDQLYVSPLCIMTKPKKKKSENAKKGLRTWTSSQAHPGLCTMSLSTRTASSLLIFSKFMSFT